jgi:hypothetical protein
MVRAELGLRGRPTVRRGLFAFFAVPILVARCQGRKSRMALRAEQHRQRLSASSAVRSRGGGWPTWGLVVASRRRLQGARVLFAKLRNNPGLRRGKAPPAGFGTGGGTTRGRTGKGHGGRGFSEIAQRPRLPPGQARPAGFGTGGFLRNCATTLGSSVRGHALRSSARGCARCNSLAPAWWQLPPGWIFGRHTLTRVAARPARRIKRLGACLGPHFAAQTRKRER